MLYKKVLDTLSEAGYESYLVGGCVRNMLLGLPIKDYDICTAATPEQVKALFSNVDMVGAHFGVSLVKEDNESIEVATFRTEGSYSDGRRPDEVKYTTNILEDLQRRDFTINTILIDHTGDTHYLIPSSFHDINNKIIRCVGDPRERFEEDALRIFRAVRFAAELNFRIELETSREMWLAIPKKIINISVERIAIEFNRMLISAHPSLAIYNLWRHMIIDEMHPDLAAIAKNFNSTLLQIAFEKMPKGKPVSFYLAALFFCNNMKFDDITFLRDYKYSNDVIKEVQHLLNNLHLIKYMKDMSQARLMRYVRDEYFWDFKEIYEAVTNDKMTSLQMGANRLHWTQAEFWPIALLTGDDLINLGFTPGPSFKAILYEIETVQLEGKIKTFEEAAKLAKEIYDKLVQ